MFGFLRQLDKMVLLRIGLSLGGLIGGLIAATLRSNMPCVPSNRAGIVEELSSLQASLRDGRMLALASETGYRTLMLRGGMCYFLWKWQCRVRAVLLRSFVRSVRGSEDGRVAAMTSEERLRSTDRMDANRPSRRSHAVRGSEWKQCRRAAMPQVWYPSFA